MLKTCKINCFCCFCFVFVFVFVLFFFSILSKSEYFKIVLFCFFVCWLPEGMILRYSATNWIRVPHPQPVALHYDSFCWFILIYFT